MYKYRIYFLSLVHAYNFILEDDGQLKSESIISKDVPVSPNRGKTRSGSNSTELAVDQLQASEKLIAGKNYNSVLIRFFI